jgi:spoIIIJ-associated protein
VTLQVEATGETVGEAKWSALRELEKLAPGLDKGAVHFQVVSEGERGLLGVGYAPARVLAIVDETTAVAPEPTDESEPAARARELVQRVADALGVECRISVREDADSILVSCTGRDLGMLIGRHGQTIDAMQYLANAIRHRAFREETRDVVVDAAGYRERRRATLEQLAVRSAQRAVNDGEAVELEPMTAVERKVVHLRLKEFPGVETSSEGTEPNRFVVVLPAAERPVRDSGPVEGDRGNRVPPAS